MALVVLGVGVMILRRWLVREHRAYLRRHSRNTAGYQTYLRLFEDERRGVLVLGLVGAAMVVAGVIFLASGY